MKLIPALLFTMLLTACGSDSPDYPDKEIPTDEISAADFVGAWKLDTSHDPVYLIFEPDRTGSIITGDEFDITYTRKQEFVWKNMNNTLTMTFNSFSDINTVLRISSTSMTLVDADGYKHTYQRIKKSDIPGEEGSGDDGGNNGGNTSSDVKTKSATPSAFHAVLTGEYSGTKSPQLIGFEVSYNKDFPGKYTQQITLDGKIGGFTAEATKLVDLATVYYRAYAVVNDIKLYGETKSFNTLQGTYKINGKEYKFIKVSGLNSGSFSMMQTELPPDATFEIDGVEAVLNSNPKDDVTKGETREFDNKKWPVMFRYPSAQEWMFAASGGNMSKNFRYSGSNDIDEVAWYTANANGHVRTPAQKKANELGFYDMSGNYAEICAVYDEDEVNNWIKFPLTFTTQSQNMSASLFNNMWDAKGGVFGGSWKSSASDCTANSSEKFTSPSDTNKYNGNIYCVRWVYSRPD